ncbi:MAG TPA: phasin [Pseudorhodoplanes sp.]|jgi:phasin|nr:phasin [Pseudorhodoplanes sp.]
MAKDPISFEMPQEMRQFVEQSVGQAQQAFDSFMAAAKSAVSGMEDRASAARAGAKDVTAKAISYAQRNIAASFEHAQKLVQAKGPEEVLKLQGDFVKAQMQTLNEQARELAELASRAAAKTTQG